MIERIALVVCAALLPCMGAPGQLTFMAQTRSVSATGPGGGTPEFRSAADFGPFTETVSSTGPSGGIAVASQTSSLKIAEIKTGGSANPGKNALSAFGVATTFFSTTFVAGANLTFSLSGPLSYTSGSLSGPGVSINLAAGQSGSVSTTGTLQAGKTYTLGVSSSGAVFAGSTATGSFDLTLTITGVIPAPQGTAFTYQGALKNAQGETVSTPCDLRFALFPASSGGFQIGPALTFDAVPLSNGVFTRILDFGPVFDGQEKWMEISVRNPAGIGDFTAISPRTRLDAVPYASSVPWAGVTGVPANVSGAYSPWTSVAEGISYSAGKVNIGNVTPDLSLNVQNGIGIGNNEGDVEVLAFGKFNPTVTAQAQNTDPIAFQRVDLASVSPNQSELRLIIGDDAFNGAANADSFAIGSLFFGTWQPAFSFRSDGVASKPGGGSWAAISDPRTKHDVSPLKGTLDRLLSLRGYQYFYNESEVKNGRALPGLQIGLMADEVERVFPDWVSRDKDGMRMVTERSTTALMVEALRDLRAEKDEQIRQRDARIEALEARLLRLEAAIERGPGGSTR